MQNCSLKRRMLLVLIALLFLPAVSAFAVNNTFPVTVLDEAGNAVVGATVYAWDSYHYYSHASGSGITGLDGKVTLVLGDLYNAASNLSKPEPNVYFLALPDHGTNSGKLAFGIAKTIFYNFYGVDGQAEPLTITLKQGCELTVTPKISDGITETMGIVSKLKVYLPGVPEAIKCFEFTSMTTPWSIVWPKNIEFRAYMDADSAKLLSDQQFYYDYAYRYIPVGNESTQEINLVHERQTKGKLVVNVAPADTECDLEWSTSGWSENWWGDGSVYFSNSTSVYLPKGTYTLQVKPWTADPDGYSQPVSIFANVVIGDTDVVKNIDIADGSLISGNVALGGEGNISYASNLIVKVQQEIDLGNNNFVWATVDEDSWVTDGTFSFSRKFANNARYRIVAKNSSKPELPGIYYNDGTTWRCFTEHLGEPFLLTANHQSSITLPQAAGLQVQVTAPEVNNILASNIRVAYPPTPENNLPQLFADSWWHYDGPNQILFIPFIDANRDLLVKVDYNDYDANFPAGENTIISKVSPALRGVAGKTEVHTLNIDPTNFVTVTSGLIASETGQMFSKQAYAAFTPIIVTANGRHSAAEVFDNYRDNLYGFDVQVLNLGQKFVFKTEKGRPYRLEAKEDSSKTGLEGFLSSVQEFQMPVVQTGDVVRNIMLDEGRSFTAIVQIDGAPVSSQNFGIAVRPVIDEKFYNYDLYGREAQVLTSDQGSFRVSGMKPGRYQIQIVPGGQINQTDFASQNMPVILREIFVGENDTSYPTAANPNGTRVVLNLNTAAMGWLVGSVVDDKNQPVVGAMVEVRRPGNVTSKGEVIFQCSTGPDGKFLRMAAIEDLPNNIPLENGGYEIFVVGATTKPENFSYLFSTDSRPLATTQIYSNGQETPCRIVLKRTFPATVTVLENGQPVKYMSCQILDANGQAFDFRVTDDSGKFTTEGILPGPVQFGLMVSSGENNRFYLEQGLIEADKVNSIELDLNPDSLGLVSLQTADSSGVPLANADGSLYFFADKDLGFRGPHSYLNWVQSDFSGRMNLWLPQLANASFSYGFQGYVKSVSVNNNNFMYSPPELTYLTVPTTVTQILTWKAPKTVEITASNIPADKAGMYFGVIMPEKTFLAGKPVFKYDTGMPNQGYDTGHMNGDASYAAFENGKFTFRNVVPGKNYVFVAYEAFEPFDTSYLAWEPMFPTPAVFRHVSTSFSVADNIARTEIFASVAPLNVLCSQAGGIPGGFEAVKVYFTASKNVTTGNSAWPVIDAPHWEETVPSGYPLALPAGFALRIVFTPPANSGYLAKTYENFIVEAGGSSLDMVLTKLPGIEGNVTIGDNQPLSGQMVLIPDGIDPLAGNYNPIRVPITAGVYNGFLKPGFYRGYVLPVLGYAKYISFAMGTETLKLDYDLGKNGHLVSGKVGLANSTGLLGLPGAAVIVTRKASATSSLTDGQKMFPYPALMGGYEIACDQEGRFSFQAENGVDYYLQAVVPGGFNPGLPVKAPASSIAQNFDLVVKEGGVLKGTMNVAGYVEAKPVGVSAVTGQFGTPTSFFADASIPAFDAQGNVQNYPFRFVGLDSKMLYNLTFWPFEPGYSYKKMANVDPNTGDLEPIVLGEGYKITGQLVDATGKPLNAASVSVNLALTLAAETPVLSSVRSNYQVRQSVRANTTSYQIQDAMMTGMWASTNEYGQFTFQNVPQFLLAFIKTEQGFLAEGVTYGRARTDNFAPAFVNNVMHFEIKVPIGGRIIGRLIDDLGKPVSYAAIDANLGLDWAWGNVSTDGNFSLEGLSPGANWMIQLMEMPGYVRVNRTGVLVEPGKTTDLGTILVARAVSAFGIASGTNAIIKESFAYGVPDKTDLVIVSVDGSSALTDNDLLSGKFMQTVTGETDLYLDPSMEIDESGFSLSAKPGKAHVGAILSRESDHGFDTLVSWGWKVGLVIPTQEQLEYGAFNITSGTTPIEFPQKFGDIGGTLSHSADASIVFNAPDAVIALLPVDSKGVLLPTPFPTALTRAVNGKWFIKNVPHGKYRIKVITQKFGVHFPDYAIAISGNPVTENLSIGANVTIRTVKGKVVIPGTSVTPVVSAKVSLVLHGLSTVTDTNGDFKFYLTDDTLFMPQVEISKPGIKTVRLIDAGGIATAGIKLADVENVDLGNLEVSASVGTVEVTVKTRKTAHDPAQICIGGEVALVYQEAGNPTWIVGEVQTTNENGVARFMSVPMGKEVSFRARAHYYVPTIGKATVEPAAGKASCDIVMLAAPPKVFYTGVAEPIAGDNSQFNLKASFDFNQVVVKNDVGLYIGNPSVNRREDCSFPDLIGTRITNMLFKGSVTPVDGNLIATVTYTGLGDIGRFSILNNVLFRKEYEVDPLAQTGFTGRQTDAAGNVLPAGITVPPGYLHPEIDSFNLEVATPTINQGDALVDDNGNRLNVVPEFAGPAFKFTFGGGESNYGGGNQQEGLFEITIAYTPGAGLEPRWYDPGAGTWSKVGINKDSIRWNHPQEGYVTFKVDHLTEFAMLKNVVGASGGLRCDFDGNGKIGDEDIMFLVAAIQTKLIATKFKLEFKLEEVKKKADKLYPNYDFSRAILPDNKIDDLDGDSNGLGDADLMAIVAYIQTKLLGRFGVICDTKTVTEKTGALLPSFVGGNVMQLPGEAVSR